MSSDKRIDSQVGAKRSRVSHEGEDERGGTPVLRTLTRGLDILALFHTGSPEWTVPDICAQTGLHRATVHRLTTTMVVAGFLAFDPGSHTYRVGSRLVPIGLLASSQAHLVAAARPRLEALAAQTGETAILAIERDMASIIVDMVATSRPFKPTLPIGRVDTDFGNAHSKLFVAFADERSRLQVLSRPLPKVTPRTITDPALFAVEIDRIVREGVAYDIEEHIVGICGVAAPVRDASERVVAGVGIIAPVERADDEQMQSNAEAVRKFAVLIGESLGHTLGG